MNATPDYFRGGRMNEQYTTQRSAPPEHLTAPSGPPATEKQVSFINRLLDERELPEGTDLDEIARRKASLTKSQASKWIERLLELPKLAGPGTVEQPVGDWPDVPAGRYALVELEDRFICIGASEEMPQAAGPRPEGSVVKFYRVDRPTEGRWAGYTFLSAQASDDLWPIKERAAKRRVLEAIALNPQGASRLYGLELGSCGVCGRTLTDETSRAYGIGPVCRENTGW